jgi:hypothetical protein
MQIKELCMRVKAQVPLYAQHNDRTIWYGMKAIKVLEDSDGLLFRGLTLL